MEFQYVCFFLLKKKKKKKKKKRKSCLLPMYTYVPPFLEWEKLSGIAINVEKKYLTNLNKICQKMLKKNLINVAKKCLKNLNKI